MRTLTRILGVLRANIIVASIQNILVHQRRSWCNLPEKADLDWLANLDTLALLYKDLACVFTSILAIQRRYTILLGMVTLFEGLQSSHEVVSAGDTVRDDALGDTGRDCTLDYGSDGVHGSHDLGLELWWDVQLDLLEEVFRGTEAADD